MEITDFTIKLFFILLPGTIATLLIEQLTTHKKWSQFQFVLYAILLGLSSYIILQIVYYCIDIFMPHCTCGCHKNNLTVWQIILSEKVEFPLIEIIWASFISILLGLILTRIIQFGLINRVGQWLKVTNKYGSESLFIRFLSADEVIWIYLRDKEKGLVFLGKVEKYSEDDKIKELSLMEVTVYGYDDAIEYYYVDRILLTYPIEEKLQIEIVANK